MAHRALLQSSPRPTGNRGQLKWVTRARTQSFRYNSYTRGPGPLTCLAFGHAARVRAEEYGDTMALAFIFAVCSMLRAIVMLSSAQLADLKRLLCLNT
jgi:hypothetical protein